MVDILYEPKTITLEKIKALAQVAKLNLNVATIDFEQLENLENGEAFGSLEEVASFLINMILNNKMVDDFQEFVNDISSSTPSK